MEKLKIYFTEVVLKKLGPSFIKSAITAVTALVAAKSGVLDKYGISADNVTGDITFHSKIFLAWIESAGGLAFLASLLTLFQHHTTAVITGAPQSGDVRKEPDVPIEGGVRKTDLPLENTTQGDANVQKPQ